MTKVVLRRTGSADQHKYTTPDGRFTITSASVDPKNPARATSWRVEDRDRKPWADSQLRPSSTTEVYRLEEARSEIARVLEQEKEESAAKKAPELDLSPVTASRWSEVDPAEAIPDIPVMGGTKCYAKLHHGWRWYLACPASRHGAWALVREESNELVGGFVATTADAEAAQSGADQYLAGMPNDVTVVTKAAKRDAEKNPRVSCPLCTAELLLSHKGTFRNHLRGDAPTVTCDASGATPAEALELRRTFTSELGRAKLTLLGGGQGGLSVLASTTGDDARRVKVRLPVDEVVRLVSELNIWLEDRNNG